MSTRRRHLLQVGTLLLGVVVLVGCQTQPWAAGNDSGSYAGRPRSLALDSRAMPAANPAVNRGGSLPWYATRNDVRTTVVGGVDGGILETSTTLTYDRQRFHGGRVHDQFDETTYRTRTTYTAK